MKRITLLNGPPRCGKTTIARAVGGDVIGFSYHLKRMVHGIYLGRDGWDLDPDAFDAVKGDPQAHLSGMSWRQAYIHYSEQVIKPLHGEGWFGEMFVRAAQQSPHDHILVPDSGFRGEAVRVVEAFGPENVTLIRIARPGASFDGDSRSYIDLSDLGVRCYDMANTSTVDVAAMAVCTFAHRFWSLADALG